MEGWLFRLAPCLSLVLLYAKAQRAPVGYASIRNAPADQSGDQWAGHRAAVDPRFPVARASYKLRSEGVCGDVDPLCWEKLSQASIFVRRTEIQEPLFSRKPGFTCEECLAYCISATDAQGNSCKAAIYDHRAKVCDLFNVDGQTPTHYYHVARHPGRDYFRPIRNPGCLESGFDTRIRGRGKTSEVVDPSSVELVESVEPDVPEKKEADAELKLSNNNPLVETFGGSLGGPLPSDLPTLPLGGPVHPSLLESPLLGPSPIGQGIGAQLSAGFGPPGVNPFSFQGQPLAGDRLVGPLPGSSLVPGSGAFSGPGGPVPLPPAPPSIQPAPLPSVGVEGPVRVQVAGAEAPTGDGYGPQASLKIADDDKQQCSYDANCWEQRNGCSVNNGFLFRRISGVNCGECVRICNDHIDRPDEYVCKAVRYDHRFQTCDLFSDARIEIGGPTDLRFPDVAGRKTADGAVHVQCYRRIPKAKCGPDGSFVPPIFSPSAKLKETGDVCPPGIDGERQVARFLVYMNKDLDSDSYLVLSTEDVNPEKCQEACNNEHAETKCRSFDFHDDFGCELNLERKGDKTRLVDKKGSTYYEKSCLPESAENTERSWVVYPQKLLLGFARAVVDAPTMRECQICCLEAEKNFGFPCRSLMYYREDGLNCILNSDTRKTRPDNFIDEGIADMVYIDVPRSGEVAEQKQKGGSSEVIFDADGWSPWSECEDGFHVRHRKCDEAVWTDCEKEFLACPQLEFLPNGFTAWSSCEDGFMIRYEKCDRENKLDCPKEHTICSVEESNDYSAQ